MNRMGLYVKYRDGNIAKSFPGIVSAPQHLTSCLGGLQTGGHGGVWVCSFGEDCGLNTFLSKRLRARRGGNVSFKDCRKLVSTCGSEFST